MAKAEKKVVKVEKKVEAPKATLAETLSKISAKNKQITDIRNLQNENQKLKDMVGRKKEKGRQAGSGFGNIKGLQGLQTGLGQQFNN